MNYFKVTDDDNNYDYDAYNRNMDEYFDDGHHTIITVRFVKCVNFYLSKNLFN